MTGETLGGIGPRNLKRFRHGDVAYDQRDGIGNVPDVDNIEYLGFVVLMRPSTYLAICPPLDATTKSPGLRDAIAAGKPISMGFIQVDLTEDEFVVHRHEGRNRARAILDLHGDDPIPVAVLLRGGDRARHVTDEHLARLAAGVRRQPDDHEEMLWHRFGRKTPFVEGPLFERVLILGEERSVAPVAGAAFRP